MGCDAFGAARNAFVGREGEIPASLRGVRAVLERGAAAFVIPPPPPPKAGITTGAHPHPAPPPLRPQGPLCPSSPPPGDGSPTPRVKIAASYQRGELSARQVPACPGGRGRGGGAGGDGPVPAPHGALSAAPHTGGAERRPAALSCQSAAGGTAAPHRTAAAPGGDRTAHSAGTERLGGMEAPNGAPRTAAGNAARHPNPTAVPHSRPDPTRHRPQLPQHRSGHSSP